MELKLYPIDSKHDELIEAVSGYLYEAPIKGVWWKKWRGLWSGTLAIGVLICIGKTLDKMGYEIVRKQDGSSN